MPKKKEKSKEKNKEKARDKVLVIDLECTCWRGRPPKGQRQEIIEIGICALDLETRKISKERGILIKNTGSKISKFCTKLTSITQEMIDKEGVSFEKACRIIKEEYLSNKRMWFSWDMFDRNQFIKECLHKDVEYPLSDYHFNAKSLFKFKHKMKNDPSVQNALKHVDLEFDGRPHRGVDDAVNTARIVETIFDNASENGKLNI